MYKSSMPSDRARKRLVTFGLALKTIRKRLAGVLRVGSCADWPCLDVQAAKGLCHTGVHQGAIPLNIDRSHMVCPAGCRQLVYWISFRCLSTVIPKLWLGRLLTALAQTAHLLFLPLAKDA